jgi:hypothetical protein
MPRAAGFAENDRRTIDLEVKACTNYWLVASRDVRVSAEYEIKVDHERRVYNCQPPATPTVAAAPATPASTPTAVTPAASAATK